MFLKNLQISGFKSFGDSVNLEFKPGFTAIVGPNGCGKSNVADSIRWVLGEQSSKTLRGTKMEDVIFNGTEARKAKGMAEVSLVFTNIPKIANNKFSIFDELKVTRRLYRSGESDYLINKIPCRLKDITDIFLDTGLNTRSFSIIEQGQISTIINSKPEEKRALIENVAGTMKYNIRKAEALKKLKDCKGNLERVDDIVNEIKKQLGSLKRQAKKAETYKIYKASLREESLKKIFFEFNNLTLNLKKVITLETSLVDKDISSTSKSSKLSSNIEEERLEIAKLSKELTLKSHRLVEVKNSIMMSDEKVGIYKSQVSDTNKISLKLEATVEELKQKTDAAKTKNVLLNEDIKIVENEIITLETEFNEKREKNDEIFEIFRVKKNELEMKERKLIDNVSKISSKNNILTSLKTKLEMLNSNSERLKREENEAISILNDAKNKVISKEELLSKSVIKFDDLKNEEEENRLILNSLKEDLSEIEENILSLNHDLNSKQAKYDSLISMQENYEGFDDGVRAALLMKKSSVGRGLHGVLLDFIETSGEYEEAIESVLGEKVQGIITESHSDSILVLNHLKKESLGKSTFLPLKPRKIMKKLPEVKKGLGLIGNALNLIKYNNKYSAVLEELLGDVVIVENIDAGLKLWDENSYHYTIVTVDGDIITPYGSIKGGSKLKKDNFLLKKKRYVLELRLKIDKLQIEILNANKMKELKKEELISISKMEEDFRSEIYKAEVFCTHEKKDIETINNEILRLKNRLDTHLFEKENLTSNKNELLSDILKGKETILNLSKEKDKEELNISDLKDEIRYDQEYIDTHKDDIRNLEVTLATKKNECNNLKNDISRRYRFITDTDLSIHSKSNELKESMGKTLDLEDKIKNFDQSVMGMLNEKEMLDKVVNEMEESLLGREEILLGLEKEFLEVSKNLKDIKDEKNGIELKKSEINIKIEFIKNKLFEDYDYGTDDLLEMFKGKDVDLSGLDEKITNLKKSIEQIGNVNLSAIKEYEVLNERYEFLTSQSKDLENSILKLNDVIRTINKTTKQLFSDTFNSVRENFISLFRRLFGGGRADIILTNPEDILTTGIEIIAQPPGKKFQSMNLFSAGEKTMTSIALVFAMFRVKPSPFCLLDEVDAPLDETNIVRFKDLLIEMEENTQFIIISHNQKTMSFADRLYGVTMEEKGVSKVVSVDLNEAIKQSENSLFGEID